MTEQSDSPNTSDNTILKDNGILSNNNINSNYSEINNDLHGTNDKTIIKSSQKNSHTTSISNDKTLLKSPNVKNISPSPTIINKIEKFRDYFIELDYPALGAEADIFRVRKNDKHYILKLYRTGIVPPVIDDVVKIAREYPEHIIQFEEYGFDDFFQKYYEIQEFANFGSLKDLIKEKKVTIKDIKTIVKEVSSALHLIHSHNLIYRDLKPGNILVRDVNPIDLILNDFGISCSLDPDVSRNFSELKGTITYWAPEQLSGMSKIETDYWALGIIILEIILGQNPFSSIEPQKIRAHIATKNIEIPQNIDSSLILLLKGLLTRDPDKRWGYKQISLWISGVQDIPEFYEIQKSEDFSIPYQFKNGTYFHPEELIGVMIADPESWNEARKHIGRKLLSKWYSDNGYQQKSIDLDSIIENERDVDVALFRIALSINNTIPFVFCGRIISSNNLTLYLGKFLKKECTPDEELIINRFLNGNILGMYIRYRAETKNKDEILYIFLKYIKEINPKNTEDLQALFKFMRIFKEFNNLWNKDPKEIDFLEDLWNYYNDTTNSEIKKYTETCVQSLFSNLNIYEYNNPLLYLRLIVIFHEIGKINDINDIIKRVIELDPMAGVIIAYSSQTSEYDHYIRFFSQKINSPEDNNSVRNISTIYSSIIEFYESIINSTDFKNANSEISIIQLSEEKISSKKFIDALFIIDHGISQQLDNINLWMIKSKILCFLNSEDYAHWCLNHVENLDLSHFKVIFSRSLLFSKFRRYEKAEVEYSKIESHMGDDINYLIHRGMNYLAMGNANQAILSYSRAIKIKPENTEIYIKRADIYFSQNQIKEAFADYRSAYKLNPKGSRAALGLAYCYYHKQKYDKSLEFVNFAENQFPGDSEILKLKIKIFSKLKKYKEAEPFLDRIINFSQDDREFVKIVANTLFNNKRYFDAIESLLSYIRIHKTDSHLLLNVSKWLIHLGFVSESLACLNFIETNKYDKQKNFYLGFVLMNLSFESGLNWIDAKKHPNINYNLALRKFLYPSVWMKIDLDNGSQIFLLKSQEFFMSLSQTDYLGLFGASISCAISGNNTSAWKYFQIANELNVHPDDSSIDFILVKSLLFFYNGNSESALVCLSKIKDPKYNFLVLDIMAGIEFMSNGNYEKSHEYLDKALNETPNLIDLYLHKAVVLIAEKKYDDAINLLDSTLLIRSPNAWGDLLQGYCHYLKGEFNRAELYYSSALSKNRLMKIGWIMRAANMNKIGNSDLKSIYLESAQKLPTKFGLIKNSDVILDD